MKTVKVILLNIKTVEKNKDLILGYVDKKRVEKASRFVKEQDVLLSLGGAYLIKKYVGDFFVDDKGKPRSKNAFFNISHSYDLVGIALSDGNEVGLDIEMDREEKDDVVGYCLTDEEMKVYNEGRPFLSLYVAKESLAKAEGSGLKGNVKIIPALPTDGQVEYKGKKYFRHSFDIDGYFLSVSLEGEDFFVETEYARDIDM